MSEVLFLCEQHGVDLVIIAAEVEDGEMIEKGLRGTVFRLKPDADAAYVQWELSQCFPNKHTRFNDARPPPFLPIDPNWCYGVSRNQLRGNVKLFAF